MRGNQRIGCRVGSASPCPDRGTAPLHRSMAVCVDCVNPVWKRSLPARRRPTHRGYGPGRPRWSRPDRDRASSASRHSTSSRSAAPPENVNVITPPGGSFSANETASRLSVLSLAGGIDVAALHARTRSKRSAERQRRNAGASPFAASPVEAIERRPPAAFRPGASGCLPTFTTASWRCAETTPMSSPSRATSLRRSMTPAFVADCDSG